MKAQLNRLIILLTALSFLGCLGGAAYNAYHAHNAQKLVELLDGYHEDWQHKCWDKTIPSYNQDLACDAARDSQQEFNAAVKSRDNMNEWASILFDYAILLPLCLNFIFFSFTWVVTGKKPDAITIACWRALGKRLILASKDSADQNIRSISTRDLCLSPIAEREQTENIIQRTTRNFLLLYMLCAFVEFFSLLVTGYLGGLLQLPKAVAFLFVPPVLALIVRKTNSRIVAGFLAVINIMLFTSFVLGAINIGMILNSGHNPLSASEYGIFMLFIGPMILMVRMVIKTFLATLKLKRQLSSVRPFEVI